MIDFWVLGNDIAERMGLIGEANAIGYHVRQMRIVDDRGRLEARFGTRIFDELTGGRFVTLPRGELSRLLFQEIERQVETIFDDEIIAIDQDADNARVQFRRAGRRRFDLVIGADGLHSAVRKLVFGHKAQFETDLGYRVAAFETSGYRPRDPDVYLVYSQPGRMVGRFALSGERTLFLMVFASDAPIPPTLGAQKSMLREVYAAGRWECPQILDELDRASELYIDRVSQIRMPAWWNGRVALVGDAAFCVSLLAGQGSALAMTAAYVLAGELGLAQGDYVSAFANYESMLRSHIASRQRSAVGFAAALAPKTQIGLQFRNLVVKAFAVPGLARLAIGRDIADTLELPAYPWRALDQLAAS